GHPAGRFRAVGVVPDVTALGEHVGTVGLGQVPQGPRYDLLGVTEAVHGRGVHPVDPGPGRGPDRGDRVVVLLVSPGEGPAAATDRPGAEPGPGNGHVSLPEGNLGQRLAHAPMLGEPRFICPTARTASTATQCRQSAEWRQPGPLHTGQLAFQPLVLTLLLGGTPVVLVGQVGPLEWVGLE